MKFQLESLCSETLPEFHSNVIDVYHNLLLDTMAECSICAFRTKTYREDLSSDVRFLPTGVGSWTILSLNPHPLMTLTFQDPMSRL